MQIVIDIDEDYFEIIKHDVAQGNDYKPFKLIANGTLLDEHDEEVIKETVESIWGKPPYTELLDKIRDEIEGNMESIVGKYDSSIPKFNMPSYKIERNKAREECISIIDKYREEQE